MLFCVIFIRKILKTAVERQEQEEIGVYESVYE